MLTICSRKSHLTATAMVWLMDVANVRVSSDVWAAWVRRVRVGSQLRAVSHWFVGVQRGDHRDAGAVNIETDVGSLWRYAAALPVERLEHRVTLNEGWTPLVDAPRTARTLGCARLLVKDEGRNPTGSFKDRSASVTVSRLRECGARGLVLSSTGNAGAAFAVYAARAGVGMRVNCSLWMCWRRTSRRYAMPAPNCGCLRIGAPRQH